MISQPSVGDLVLIEWDDIQVDTGWEGIDKDVRPASCKSVGFVTVVRPRYAVLASMIGLEDATKASESNVRQSIPWGCVTKWRKLK